MMQLDLKISDQEINELVSGLTDSTETLEVFSAAGLSQLTEPGDRFAGRLVGNLGFTKTLALVVNRCSPQFVAEQLKDEKQKLENDFNADFSKLWEDALQRWTPRLNLAELRSTLIRFQLRNGKLISRDSKYFPQMLFDLGDACPLTLWLRGNPEVLAFERSLAIVGSRIATNYGQQVTVDIAEVCAERQVTTVSGGAFGIDTLVHRASLELESPTIAVLAGGLDHLYPRGNAPLFEAMLKANAIIAEVEPPVAPAMWRFLMRNRLIAALGQATVVVEAGKRSGSISTAGHAIDLDRAVAVVPGRIFDSSSRGCLDLLRAKPLAVEVLTSPEDALELIGLGGQAFELRSALGPLETRALDAFGRRTLTLLDVQRIAGLTFNEAQLAVGRLELEGYLERQFNGYRKINHNLET